MICMALCLACACAGESAERREVRSAASVDLDCDPSDIKLDDTRPRLTVASGCGKQQMYRYKCFGSTTDKKDCKWVPMEDPGN